MFKIVITQWKVSEIFILFNWAIPALDCSFEEGPCAWKSPQHPHNAIRGEWYLYDCNTITYGNFLGMEKDVTFPGGTSKCAS